MNNSKFVLGMLFLFLSLSVNAVMAGSLVDERKAVCIRYVRDLQAADYKDIIQLFVKGGFVVSTSKGHMDAKDFFYSFLPNIRTAKAEIHEGFVAIAGSNLAVRFNFEFEMKDGEVGHGEYVDVFTFATNSEKLMSVSMFENLHFT